MSQENVELVSRMYQAFGRGDAVTALSYVHSAVVTDPRHRVDGRVGQGHDDLVAILAEWLDTWDEWRQEIEEIRDLGDRVLVLDTQRGRGKGSGIEWEGRFAMLYEVQQGKITRWTIYDDPSEALEAAGLSE
jgi:ketosteroid isomerase-like protein